MGCTIAALMLGWFIKNRRMLQRIYCSGHDVSDSGQVWMGPFLHLVIRYQHQPDHLNHNNNSHYYDRRRYHNHNHNDNHYRDRYSYLHNGYTDNA